MDSPLPRLRPIETFPVAVDGHQLVCLRDPHHYAAESIVVPPQALFVLGLLDGRHSALDVQEAFARRYGTALDSADLRELVDLLDRYHFLDTARFASRRAAVEAAYHDAPLRPAAHAGASYPAEAAACRTHLERFFEGLPPPPPTQGRLRGLIAPHIDLRVGGTAYGHAYRALAANADAWRFVILGTSHCGGETLFTATRKHFATPLGPVATDTGFLRRLASRVPEDLYRDELLHRTEHSVEFQVVMLQHVLGAHGNLRIVPLLVTSFHEMILRHREPASDPRVAGFLQALRETMREDDIPTVIIAGVDFAHVGEKFGDPQGLAPELVAGTEQKDHRLIAALEASDPGRFFEEVAADGDRTRICGFAPMYTLLALMDGVPGRLLHYARTRDQATRSSVSFASLAFGLG